MTQQTVEVRSSRAAIRQAIATIPGAARSGGSTAQAMLVRCGFAILGRIKTAFVIKSRGGTDEAGDNWPDLSPKTKAYSKTRSRGRNRAERKRESRPLQALDRKQQERWWEVYRRSLARFKGDKRHAAAVAWTVLRSEGARTLVDKYGSEKVDILRDTELLLNSLSPGASSAKQIFRIGNGEVVVGTNRKGAAAHHHGAPSRNLPQRRLWPLVSKWPTTWWADIIDQAKQGLLDLAMQLIRSKS